MQSSDRARYLLVALLGLSFSSCASVIDYKASEPIPEIQPDPVYEALFLNYVELCAVSQLRSLEYGEGGVPGHAVLYIKGACKDEQAPYPRLRPCRRQASKGGDSEHGVGVSVNKWFRSVNWVAVPGRKLFFDGNLEAGERLDQAAFDAALRASIEAGVFNGVDFHDDTPTRDGANSLESRVAAGSLVTDFALRFGRTIGCARLPVTAEMVVEMIEYLNGINDEYANGTADYDWSGYSDNCVHLVRNALAAASIWRPISVRATQLRQIFNLAVPANEFVNLAEHGAHGPLANSRAVYRDDEARDSLLDFDWLPRRHGALMLVLPVHANNALYDTRFRLFVLENLLTSSVSRKVDALAEDPRFTQLEPNLRHFREVYSEILTDRDKLIAGGFLPLRSMRYLRPTKRYFGYVERQLAEVDAMLAELLDAEGP